MAVARLWHGKTSLKKGDEYQKFLVERAVPDYESAGGLLKLYFTRKDSDTAAHFLLITIWDSMISMKRFAGEDVLHPKYYLEDDNFLLEKEKTVMVCPIFYEK